MFLKKKAIVYFVTVLTKIHGDRLHSGQRGGVHAPGRVPQFFHADRSLEKLGCRGGARGVAARILSWCWCWLVLVLVLVLACGSASPRPVRGGTGSATREDDSYLVLLC